MLWSALSCVFTLIVGKVVWAVVQAQRYRSVPRYGRGVQLGCAPGLIGLKWGGGRSSSVPGFYGIAFWKWTLLFPLHQRFAFWDEHLVRDQGKGKHAWPSRARLSR